MEETREVTATEAKRTLQAGESKVLAEAQETILEMKRESEQTKRKIIEEVTQDVGKSVTEKLAEAQRRLDAVQSDNERSTENLRIQENNIKIWQAQ